jgi:hypothetical protein
MTSQDSTYLERALREANERFLYDPETGVLRYKKDTCRSKAGDLAGSRHIQGYLEVTLLKKRQLVHRVVWAMHTGNWPEGLLDHYDGDKTNNRIGNLKNVTQIENQSNRHTLNFNNTTGVKGVWEAKGAKGPIYVAEIMVKRKKISLGSFSSLEEARKARVAAEKLYQGYAYAGNQ